MKSLILLLARTNLARRGEYHMRLYKFKHRSHRNKQSLAVLIEANKQELLNNQLYIEEIERKLENKQVAMQKERL